MLFEPSKILKVNEKVSSKCNLCLQIVQLITIKIEVLKPETIGESLTE